MKLSSETQGSFNCADHDIKIRVSTRTITPGLATFRSRLPLTTSSTPFVETSGNAEWNYNGSSWVVTVQKDIPFVASNGTVAGFDRVHSNNTKENNAAIGATGGRRRPNGDNAFGASATVIIGFRNLRRPSERNLYVGDDDFIAIYVPRVR